MRLPPLANLAMLAALLLLAGVQIALVLEFWSSFAGEDPFFRLVFQGLGVGFAVIELTALVVCANAARAGAWARANTFRLIFIGLFAINLVSDIGAIYAFTTSDADARVAASAAKAADVETAADQRNRITALHAALARDDLDLPIATLEIRHAAAIALRDAGGVGPRTQTWRSLQASNLEAALATVREIERLEVDRTATQARAHAAAAMTHPQLTALATLLGWIGIEADAQTIRVGLALAMAVVLRCVLAFGFWAASPVAGASARDDATDFVPPTPAESGRADAASIVPPRKPAAEGSPPTDETHPRPVGMRPPAGDGATAKPILRLVPSPETSKTTAPGSITVITERPSKDANTPRRDADLLDALNALEDEFRPKD